MDRGAAVASASMLRDSTGQGYVLSFMLHAGIIALAWTGLPYLHRQLPTETPPLIVDLVPISEITSAPPPPAPDPAPVAPVAPPEPPAPVQAETPPADAMPPPPPKDQVPVKEPDPAPPPPKVKPTPKPPPPDTKKKDIAMLQDLLKDMAKKAPPPAPQAKSAPNQTPSNNIAPNVTDRASMTELDAIRRHIEDCWRIDPGTEGVQNMAVDLKVSINPDGSVKTAEIVDMTRYFADQQFRAFANSARNAVLGCGNIPISAERYNIFKEMTMTFSPQGRIN